jgi:hypothetical protein
MGELYCQRSLGPKHNKLVVLKKFFLPSRTFDRPSQLRIQISWRFEVIRENNLQCETVASGRCLMKIQEAKKTLVRLSLLMAFRLSSLKKLSICYPLLNYTFLKVIAPGL